MEDIIVSAYLHGRKDALEQPDVKRAIERMKPKKVVRRKTYGKKGTDEEHLLFTEYACPTCGIEIPILDMDTRFCADGCGQALDWE